MPKFEGIWVPLVTPFTAGGQVDVPALSALVRQLRRAAVHGFVVCATTGEAAVLSDDEKALVLQTVCDASVDRPVVMGVGGVSPLDVARQCRQWRGQRVAAFLVPAPHYVRPSQQGLIEFYAHVAAAADPLELIVYDIPYRTGVVMALSTLRCVAKIPGVRAIKDCGGDVRKTQALIADGQLEVLAGEDDQIFTTLCQGGHGAIAASAHLHPAHFVAMYDAVRTGRWIAARALHHALAPLVAALFAEPSPAPLKAVLATLGSVGPDVRAPLTSASAAAREAALAAYAAVDAVRPHPD